jgi:hypothetical protein
MPKVNLCAVCLHSDDEHSIVIDLCYRLGCRCRGFVGFEDVTSMVMISPSNKKIEEAVYMPCRDYAGRSVNLPHKVLISMWENIVSPDIGFLVLFTELNQNRGISVTNSVEDLTDWARRHLFETKDLRRPIRWFERHEDRPEEIDEILMSTYEENLVIGWERVSPEDFHRMTCSEKDIQEWISEGEAFGNLFEPRE